MWVFGGVEGRKFDDNSRYLFEYVCKKNENIHAVWLTQNEETTQSIKRLGYEAYTFYSCKGIQYALRAGVAVYSHALIDFGLFPLIGGAKIVCLWHGVGFKEIYNAKYHGFSLWAKKTIDRIFSWTFRHITMVTSDYTYHQFQRLFNLSPEHIFITGQPRNDVLFRGIQKEMVLSNIDKTKKWILYMPTYRGKGVGLDAMERIVVALYENEALNQELDGINAIFIVKLHPLTPPICLPKRNNFIVLGYNDVENNQELLTVADMLITDYSSCFVDYALLKRPILFYTPDETQFLQYSEQMANDFFKVSALCKASTISELVDAIKNPNQDVPQKTNHIFEDESIKGTCYSENVFNVILENI